MSCPTGKQPFTKAQAQDKAQARQPALQHRHGRVPLRRSVDTSAPSIPLIVELALILWVVFAIATAVALF